MKNKQSFNIQNVQKIQSRAVNMKVDTFEYIYNKVESKIKRSVETRQENCKYVVPKFILGLPLYDITEVIQYINSKLSANGFVPYILSYDTILITWPYKTTPNKSAISYYPEEEETVEDDIASSLLKYKL